MRDVSVSPDSKMGHMQRLTRNRLGITQQCNFEGWSDLSGRELKGMPSPQELGKI